MKKLLPKFQKAGLIKYILQANKLTKPAESILTINGITKEIPDKILIGRLDYLPNSSIGKSAKSIGFDPQYVLRAAPGNIEFTKEITIPRFVKYAKNDNPDYIDVTKSMPWFDIRRKRMSTMAPILEIEDIARKPTYLGYYTNPEKAKRTIGTYDTSEGNAFVSIEAPNIPSTVLHERNLHGSEHIIDVLAPSATKEYVNFVKNIFKDIKPIDGKIKLNEDVPEITDVPAARNWNEARATIGELTRKILYKIAKDKGYKGIEGHVKELIPEFEKYVDDIEDGKLNFMLRGINGYGNVYGYIGPKTNSNFYKELKSLIKYAPSLLLFNDYSDNE